jgi:putative DNA primase/helicase
MALFATAAEGAADLAQRCERPRQTSTGWQACCPAHEDRTPSLSITPTADRVLVHCHAGCTPEAIVAALGRTLADLFIDEPPRGRPPARRPPRVTATYDYDDAQGALLYQVRRWEPGRHGQQKSFTQHRPDPAHPGAWLDTMQGVTRQLYHLPEVLRAVAAGEPIYLPEGEKDANKVIDLGVTATTNAGGAGKWAPQYTATLRGAHIVLLQDNDASGRRHTAVVTQALYGVAASLKLVELPGLPPKGDVSDWLAAGGTRAQLEALVAQTPHWTPALAVGDGQRRRVGSQGEADPSPRPDEPPLPYSDYTNALALVRHHGQDLRYCYPWKSWLVWTALHWKRDTSGAVVRMAKQTIKRLARHAEDLDDDQAIKALLAHVKSSLATAKLKALVESAQSEPGIPVQPEDLDGDRWLLNCTNGTLDLRTGIPRPHRQADLLTKCLPVAYDPHAECPTWERFLWRIIGGTNLEDDTEDRGAGESDNRQAADDRAKRLIGFLQRAIGYSLTGETREQCLFVLHGSGANGKSTFLEVLQTLLGDYAQSTPSASLLAKDRHDGIPNDIARLRGARLVTAVEIGQGRRLNEELMKRLTGQDTITARFLHAEFFDFRAEFKLFIACNHLPTITGTDHAIWRRIRLIPFTVTIPETEQDKDLPAKLQAELPGILAWAVRGCLAWQREGLGTPEEVKQATAGYRASMDQIGRFIEECCLVSQQVRIKASELYEAYKKWCDANGEQAATLSAFGHYLEEKGFAKHKIGTIWRLGIGLHAIPDD